MVKVNLVFSFSLKSIHCLLWSHTLICMHVLCTLLGLSEDVLFILVLKNTSAFPYFALLMFLLAFTDLKTTSILFNVKKNKKGKGKIPISMP